MTSGPDHHRRRQPWNRAFSNEALKGYEEIIERRATQLVQVIVSESRAGSIDLSKWFDYFTFDFMSDMAYVSP